MGKTKRVYWEYATELDVLNIDQGGFFYQTDAVDDTNVEETLRYFKIFNLSFTNQNKPSVKTRSLTARCSRSLQWHLLKWAHQNKFHF